jgi:adenylate kinase family enzyme
MKFNRFHIVGGPGSGKSYAAKKLSAILNIPFYDLDDIFWHEKDIDYTKVMPEKERDAKLKNIIKQKKWIIEGSYGSWTDPSFKKADQIIIIKPNRYLRALRIAKRNIKAKLKIIDRKTESLKSFFKFLKWNHLYDGNNLLNLEKKINKYDYKILYFKKADYMISYFKKI